MVVMRGVSKRFGAVQALESVDLEVAKGEIHAIVGENGAGKTTLMRILYGALAPDAGEITLDGKPVQFHSAADGIAAGIGMVSQHYSIIGELTCLENLMLGAEPGVRIDKAAAEARANELARKMGFQFDWSAEASTLSPGAAQKLEILKLLWRKARIMILDEPTAMLSPADGDALFESLKQLADEGATILLVTHRLPEVMEHCRRVTVLRGGRLIESLEVKSTNPHALAEGIVGHALEALPSLEPVPPGASVLEVDGLDVEGSRGNLAVRSASFSVRQGEMVGIAGVDGSGQRELFWALMGTHRPTAGTIVLNGERIESLTARQRIERGLRMIPEDRHEEAVVDEWPLEWNASLGLQRRPPCAKGPWVDAPGRRDLAGQIAARFKTKFDSLKHPMASLSGGNQQRFVAARALALEPGLILAFQPARGLDIDATSAVYAGIREACKSGASALVVSFDLDELLENCDRVIAMNLGRVLEPGSEEQRDRAAIGRLMVGAA